MRSLAVTLSICLVALSACGGENNDGSSETVKRAQVRVVQAVLDAPVLDVYVSAASRLPAFPQVASGKSTGYVGLDQNSAYQFIVRLPGSSDVLAQLDLELGESQRALLLISGALEPRPGEQPIGITSFDDARIDPGPGKTQLRLVNATLDGTTLVARVESQELAPIPANGEAQVTVDAGKALPVTVGSVSFTTAELPPATDVTVAVIGSPSAPQGDSRALRLLAVPAVTPSNTTPVTNVASNPFAVFVNGVPGGAGSFSVDGAAAIPLAFSQVSPLLQVGTDPVVLLDGATATLSGSLDPASTYLVIVARDPITAGITMFAYRDALADSGETRIRAVNATVGSGARDIALSPAPLLGSDLVVGAASPSSGTLVTDTASVSSITATPAVGAPFVYTTGITSDARYILLIGDAASTFGAVIVDADWSASFVPVD